MGLTASYLNPGAEFEPLQRCCRHARRFASVLARHNVAILNEVSLNQVLAARRISVSSGATTDEDVERSLASLIRHLPAR